MKNHVDKDEMIRLFQGISDSFPALKTKIELTHPQVDLIMDILYQPGLKFDMSINLQGDELHLNAGHFWLEWFPCYESDIAKAFVEAVQGLLSGQYRIIEHYRGKRAVKAELQRPKEGSWETIGTWSRLHFPFLGRHTTQVLQNI